MQFLNLDLIVEQLKYNPDAPMIFNSGFFLWLFVGFMTVYAFLHRNLSLKIAFCTLFSIYFYYKSSGMYFLILLLSTFIDYWLAILIDKANEAEDRQVEQGIILDTQRRKAKKLVILSCFVNLGILGYFKYTNFLVGSILALFNQPFDPFNIFLPVGISFFYLPVVKLYD
jgi:alginate O-acetyltransferase complex protein AlgI